ncbi:hypothetical protein M2162_008083 [Streptomyces sp. SAI-041]|nr:hypothetical protein [Streptomyces sp. SAI-041]
MALCGAYERGYMRAGGGGGGVTTLRLPAAE